MTPSPDLPEQDCAGCGAPAGPPPAGRCIAHGTPYAIADAGLPLCDVMRGAMSEWAYTTESASLADVQALNRLLALPAVEGLVVDYSDEP